tara:strand:+ start:632 stop:1612 length:981 start_codon:yes stop_codon:yes gene_type:complete
MFKKKNIILAAGCSFTDPNFKSLVKHLPDNERGGWPMWPELLQREIEKETGESYELINLAISGTSNDYIFNTCIDALSKYDDRIKILLIGGTQWMRTYVAASNTHFNPQVNGVNTMWHIKDGIKVPDREPPWYNFCKNYEKAMIQMWYLCSNEYGFRNIIHHNLRIMWTLMNMCKSKKIKFIWYQLLQPLPSAHLWRKRLLQEGSEEGWEINVSLHAWEELKSQLRWTLSDRYFSETVLKSPYAKFLVKHKKHFHGFSWSDGIPWDTIIHSSHRDSDGHTYHEKNIICPKIMIDGKKVVDVHPNKLGQEEIAEELWKKYGNYLVKN